jgi:hypothetical protein
MTIRGGRFSGLKRLFVAVSLTLLPLPVQGQTEKDLEIIPLMPPYLSRSFGAFIFFPVQGFDGSQILTPGRKHLEIDKSSQRLRAYDEGGRRVLEAPVSTGNPGIDEKGRQRSETLSGIHRVFEVKPFRLWSKDPKVKMLDWIGLHPGIELGIHSLEPVGEFAHYEKLLGQKVSHGCIRLKRENSRWLANWIGEDWKAYPFIVYIYEESIPTRPRRPESPYLLILILQGGAYLYPPVSHEPVPSVQRSETVSGPKMKPGDFFLYRKEPDGWHLVRSSKKR